MIQRLAKNLIRNRAYFATQEKKNVVVVPKRHQVTLNQFVELNSQIQIAPSCKVLATLIKENLELFTDHHITHLFKHIGLYDLPIDDSFHSVIAPIAVEWVKTFSRGQTPTLGGILLALTHRSIASNELEQLVIAKLDGQNFYRYLDYQETVALFNALSKQKRFHNHSLFSKLQHVLYQQKNFYVTRPDLLRDIREGMDAVEAIAGEKPLEIKQAYKQIV